MTSANISFQILVALCTAVSADPGHIEFLIRNIVYSGKIVHCRKNHHPMCKNMIFFQILAISRDWARYNFFGSKEAP
jgi:hypothetical protein